MSSRFAAEFAAIPADCVCPSSRGRTRLDAARVDSLLAAGTCLSSDWFAVRSSALRLLPRDDGGVKRSTAINRLTDVADALDRAGQWPGPKVVAAYVFGTLLDPLSELEAVQLALLVGEPPEEVPWMSRPARLEALASLCRFDKLPVSWRWRPAAWPVWNHEISRAVRFWRPGHGRDEAVLCALASVPVASDTVEEPGSLEELARQLTVERAVSRAHLATVKAQFYDRDWRRENNHDGIHPEDHLWWATAGYLDLDDAIAALDG